MPANIQCNPLTPRMAPATHPLRYSPWERYVRVTFVAAQRYLSQTDLIRYFPTKGGHSLQPHPQSSKVMYDKRRMCEQSRTFTPRIISPGRIFVCAVAVQQQFVPKWPLTVVFRGMPCLSHNYLIEGCPNLQLRRPEGALQAFSRHIFRALLAFGAFTPLNSDSADTVFKG